MAAPGPVALRAPRQCPPATDPGAWTPPARTSRRSDRAPATPAADVRRGWQSGGARTTHPVTEKTRTAAAGTDAWPGQTHPGRVSAEHVGSGAGAREHGASRASQQINPRSKTVHVLAKLVDALEILIGFSARHEVAALVTEIFGGVAHGCCRCLACPTERGAGESTDLVSGHIA